MLHTVAEPPYEGRMSLAASGWTMNRRLAPKNEVVANRTATHTPRRASVGVRLERLRVSTAVSARVAPSSSRW